MTAYLILAVLGGVFGSFAGMLAYRLPRGKNIISPGSYCPSCDHRLSILDLFPVFSYILRLGKCNYCKKLIS
ncbi:prepilin peptidase, partial [Candidatus Margulisiibacteriota bacterium]